LAEAAHEAQVVLAAAMALCGGAVRVEDSYVVVEA
jgi:hypothetical protein